MQARSLNLWALDLSDLQLLEDENIWSNLEVLVLSGNSLTGDCLISLAKGCKSLRELYLRANLLEIFELTPLRKFRALRFLWLSENPCCQHPFYRPLVLTLCPRLERLDDTEITDSDRHELDKLLSGERRIEFEQFIEEIGRKRSEKNLSRSVLSASMTSNTLGSPTMDPSQVQHQPVPNQQKSESRSNQERLHPNNLRQGGQVSEAVDDLNNLSVDGSRKIDDGAKGNVRSYSVAKLPRGVVSRAELTEAEVLMSRNTVNSIVLLLRNLSAEDLDKVTSVIRDLRSNAAQ